MRKSIYIILVLLSCTHVLFGQIKIGDNPQIIDPASVLELESANRVLVITRINTEQMNAIVPSSGALVYNTDENCIFYFNGTEWLNLCASLGLSLTAEAIVNDFPTIILTENGTDTNIEVGEIRGSNIVDFSISAADIQNNSITADKLAPSSVGVEELQDNTVADAEIDYNQVTLADFFNDSGYITAAEIVSASNGNDIVDNGGAFYDDSGLQNDIAANTAAIAADGDTDAANEIQTLSITGNQLGIAGGNTVDLSAFNNAGTDDQILNLSGNTLTIEDGNSVDLSALNNSGSDDQTLSLSGNTLSIEDGNNVNLSVFNNPGTDDQNLTSAILSGNVLTLNIENGNPASVDLSPLSGTGTDDQTLNLSGNVVSIEDGNSIDLTPILGGGGTDDQNLSLAGNTITIEDGNSIDLTPILGGGGTDDQQLSLTGNTLTLEDGGTVNLLPYLDNTDEQDLTGASLSPGNILTIDIENGSSTTVDLSPLVGTGTDDQEAFEVPFTPTGNTASTEVQAAIEELQTEIDGISGGGVANPNDELIDLFQLNGTSLEIGEGANIPPPVDLDPVFATDAELAALSVDDADADPGNELQSISSPDASITVNQIGNDFELTVASVGSDDQNIQGSTLVGETLTIGIEDGNPENVDLSPFATDVDMGAAIAASEALDLDMDNTNEIQSITSPDASVTVNQVGDDYELTVASVGSDDQNIQGSTLVGETLTIGIEDGNPENVDLSPFATDVDMTAAIATSEALDLDMDNTNEIQSITSPDASVTVNQVGDDYELTVASVGSDDQNIQGSTLVGETLTIGIEDGNPENVDLSPFATDVDMGAAIATSEALDLDMDNTNEIQSITSPDASVTVNQVGDDYELTVAGGSTDNQNIQGSTLVGETLTIGIEDGNPENVDLSPFATDADMAAAIAASEALDLDMDNTNEIQSITSPDASVTVNQVGDDYELTVAGGSTDNQNIQGSTLVGETLTIGIEDGNPENVDLSPFATDADMAAAIAASEALDLDMDNTNEIQSITSPDASVTVNQVGDDYELTVAGGSTDNQNIQGSTLVGETLTIGIEDGNPENVDLSPFATDADMAAAIAASEALDLDMDNNNEIELPTGGTNGQILSTDGAGTYAWVDDAGGGTDTTLGDTDLIQTAGQDRTYDLNGQDLAFTGNGNFGIGTSGSPQTKLHVEGLIRSEGIHNSDGLVSEPSYRFTSDTDTGMYRSAADQLSFSAGNSEVMRMSNSRVIVNGELEINQELFDENDQAGTAGQILSSTGTGVDWIDSPSGGSVSVDGITIQGDGAGTPLFVPNGGIDSNQIATAAVTNAKIAPSGTNGQILTTNSGAVIWADPVDSSPLVGIGKINSGAGAARITTGLASSINWTGAGQCTVNLNGGFVSTSNYIINVSVQGDNRIYITAQNASSFSIEIRDSSGTLTNAVWHFTLFE